MTFDQWSVQKSINVIYYNLSYLQISTIRFQDWFPAVFIKELLPVCNKDTAPHPVCLKTYIQYGQV